MYADPYLNTDAGTMSPFEHGEVFVLDDGGEVNFQISGNLIVWNYLWLLDMFIKKSEFFYLLMLRN